MRKGEIDSVTVASALPPAGIETSADRTFTTSAEDEIPAGEDEAEGRPPVAE